MREGVRVYLYVVGNVPEQFSRKVLRILQGFYESTSNVPLPSLVEVYIYENTRAKLRALEEEAVNSGVLVVGDYVTLHEAWRGWPRIHVDYEKTHNFKPRHLEALLVHEAAHSILHGSPLYYLITIDPQLVERYGYEEALKLVYIASTIAKDLEVHELLVKQGYRKQVEAYMDYIIENQLEDTKCRTLINKPPKLEEKLANKCQENLDKIIQILKTIMKQKESLNQKTHRIIKQIAEITH